MFSHSPVTVLHSTAVSFGVTSSHMVVTELLCSPLLTAALCAAGCSSLAQLFGLLASWPQAFAGCLFLLQHVQKCPAYSSSEIPSSDSPCPPQASGSFVCASNRNASQLLLVAVALLPPCSLHPAACPSSALKVSRSPVTCCQI